MHLYERHYEPNFFFLFHFIFELLSISMVTINIVKIELINAAENLLLNIISASSFFSQSHYSLSIHIPLWLCQEV